MLFDVGESPLMSLSMEMLLILSRLPLPEYCAKAAFTLRGSPVALTDDSFFKSNFLRRAMVAG